MRRIAARPDRLTSLPSSKIELYEVSKIRYVNCHDAHPPYAPLASESVRPVLVVATPAASPQRVILLKSHEIKRPIDQLLVSCP
jgi:hypothetical protein